MRTRRIAVVGLGDDAAHALHSMLKIVDGRCGVAWAIADPDDADVLMAGEQSSAALVERWSHTAKPLIAVHEGRLSPPMAAYSLRHPFRVMQLLNVLEDIDAAIVRPTAEAPRAPASGELTPWSFAESLRRLSRGGGRGQVQTTSYRGVTLFVRDDLPAYYADAATAERLRHEWLPLPPLAPTDRTPEPGQIARPLHELAWYTGLHGPAGLAPWLDPQATYRLRRWPDFGLLRGPREHLAMAAALSHGALNRGRLAQATRQPAANVDRFLNACSLIGMLASGETAVAAQPAGLISASASRFGDLVRGLRLRLGLAG